MECNSVPVQTSRGTMHLPTAEYLEEMVLRGMTTCDNPGWCIRCGNEADGCEPDASRYECEVCGERGVYGAEELLLRGWFR